MWRRGDPAAIPHSKPSKRVRRRRLPRVHRRRPLSAPPPPAPECAVAVPRLPPPPPFVLASPASPSVSASPLRAELPSCAPPPLLAATARSGRRLGRRAYSPHCGRWATRARSWCRRSIGGRPSPATASALSSCSASSRSSASAAATARPSRFPSG